MADFDLAAEVYPNILARLGCNSAAELAPLWSADEIWEYADDQLKRMAREYGLFVQIAPPIATVAPQAQYTLPADHVAIVQAAYNGAMLRPMSVREAEALDANWTTAAGPPTRWLSDLGVDAIRTYPTPTGAGTLDVVYLGCAPDVSAAQTTVAGLTPALGDLIELSVVAEARRRESDAQMPEVAQVLDAIAAVYMAAIASYWGGGE